MSKRGRPKLDGKDARSVRVSALVREAEAKALQAAADAKGKTLSDFIREKLIAVHKRSIH